jgi:HlyD family secretion protein
LIPAVELPKYFEKHKVMKFLSKQRLVILIPAGMVALVILIAFSCRLMPKAVSLSDCITLTVHQGDIYEPIVATGTVEAENEVLIRSPYTSIVKQIYKEPGSRVQKGDVILMMEDEFIKDEIDKIKDQLDLKRNSLEKNKLSEFSTNIDLNYSEEVKKLNVTSLKTQLADEEQLLEVGGISPAKIEKTKQEIALAEKDLMMLKQKNAIRLKQLKAEEQGLNLGIKIQEKELEEKMNRMNQMRVLAPSSGIILSISNKVGEKVNTDNILVRMSDLSTFKIAGAVEDKVADYIKTGKKVYAIIDSERLPGNIGNVTPVVANNQILFNVHLEQKNHPKLISNQQIILWVVRKEFSNVLIIKNINLFDKEVPGVMYVLKNGEATRHEVKTGIKNPDQIQVLSGLEAGDTIIVPKRGIVAFHNANSVVINK